MDVMVEFSRAHRNFVNYFSVNSDINYLLTKFSSQDINTIQFIHKIAERRKYTYANKQNYQKFAADSILSFHLHYFTSQFSLPHSDEMSTLHPAGP